MATRHRVLVVDDEASMRELLEIILGGAGYDVSSAGNVEAACEKMRTETFDVVVTDYAYDGK